MAGLWFRRSVAALDWYGRLLALAGLGITGLLSSVLTGLLVVSASFPAWLTIAILASTILVVLPIVLAVLFAVRRRWDRRRGHHVPVVPTATYFARQRVYLADLVRDEFPPIIRDKTFEDCEIIGPAVVHLGPHTMIVETGFDGDLASLAYEVRGTRGAIGVIRLEDCVIRRCRMRGIGFMGQGIAKALAKGTGMAASPSIGAGSDRNRND